MHSVQNIRVDTELRSGPVRTSEGQVGVWLSPTDASAGALAIRRALVARDQGEVMTALVAADLGTIALWLESVEAVSL